MDRNTQEPCWNDCHSLEELALRVRAVLKDRILRMTQVSEITGRAHSTIWNDVSKGVFPKPIRLGPRAIGWKESEVQGWLEARSISSRSPQSIDMKEFVSMLTAPKHMGDQK
jgi:prophage regulatory protein